MGIDLNTKADATSAFNHIDAAKKKIRRQLKTAEEKAAFSLFGLARNQITRSGRDVNITVPAKLFNPKGELLPGLTPSQFIRGKKITKGKQLGRPVREVADTLSYRWTPKATKKAKSYVNNPNQSFKTWLRNTIRTKVEGNTIIVYANPAGAKNGVFLSTEMFERGGVHRWKRNILIGYKIETLTHAHVRKGKYKGQKRKFKQRRVGIRRFLLKEKGAKTFAPTPFLAPALLKFMAEKYQVIFKEIGEDL